MKSERWQQVEKLFHAALGRVSSERSAYLRKASAGDAELQREVESLLAAHEKTLSLEKAAVHLAEEWIREQQSLVGQNLGHFQVLKHLGSGGMGEVYLAEDHRLRRKVALKLLPALFTKDTERLRRFEQEAQAASALNHPNIVTIYEIGEATAGHFIVMELIEGRTLRAMIGQPLAPDALAELGGQIVRALGVAHAAGIIHRDIKPENIMVRTDGLVKVLDFGLARLTRGNTALTETESVVGTTPGMVLGTVRYMSPEQARGEKVGDATDIFSLGLVFYEMATGQHTFRADSPIGVLHAIISQPPVAPSRLNPEIPATLDALILQMLEKDARLRPTAVEVNAALTEMAGKRARPETGRAMLSTKRHTVGREKERAELRAGFEAVTAGRGLLLCAAGEPGIGKTTLVEDFLSEVTASGEPCAIARGRSSERLAGTEAYLPFLEALDSLLHGEANESMTRLMRLLAPTWYAQVAPLSAEDASDARVLAEVKMGSQERLKRELFAYLQEVSRLRPLVLFFDDLHWADVSSIDLLAYLATKFGEMRVLIVTTYRPSDLLLAKHPFLQVKLELQGRGACREILLEFLSAGEVEKYLALDFPEHRFPAELPRLIHAKTEGNPLFMADLVRYLRDRKVIAEEQGRWTLAQSVPEIERDLPESVRSLIERKIAQLSENDRRLLVAASVQGYEFDSAVVAKALAADPGEVEERLEALERVYGFVRLVEEREFPDRTLTLRYRFVHVLYQNALYGSLRPTRKAQLSTAVAEALLGYCGTQRTAIASELAMLFEAARDFERAAEYFLFAAEQAAHVSANKEAVVLARRGLDALRLLPETPERAQQELHLQTILGPALMSTAGHGTPEAEAVYTRARELCQQVGETPQLFPVIWGLWQSSVARGELQTCRELGEQLLALAQKLQDPALLLLAHHTLASTFWLCGNFELWRMHAEQAIAIYIPEQHRSLASLYGGHDTGVANRSGLAVSLWVLGYPDQALQKGQEAISLAHEISHPSSVGLALIFEAMIHHYQRDAQRTRQQAEAAIALAIEQELAPWLAWATVLRGWALAEQGQAEEGIAQLRQGIADARTMGFRVLLPYFLALLAEAYVRTGKAEEGLPTVAEALAITEQTHEGFVEAEIHRLKGELLLMRAVPDESGAEGCFRQAIDVARRQKAKSFELRAVMSLSRLYQKQGKQSAARQRLAEIYGWFTEGFDTLDLKEAKALLAELSEEGAGVDGSRPSR